MASVDQLPRGRHGLSRAEVATSQRERMLRSMAEAVAERGYANTPVAEVLRRAGVSRETFYEQFANKEECFLAAYDAGATLLLEAMAEGSTSSETGAPTGDPVSATQVDPLDPLDPLDEALSRYLAALAREPAVARTFLVEVYAAGPAALARRVEIQRRFADNAIALVGARGEDQRFACEAIVAAISALVTQRLCAGRGGDMTDLHQPLSHFARTTLRAAGIPPDAAA